MRAVAFRDMEFGWLEDFIAVAECLHFGRAADRRHVTQSAMSRRVQALEAWLGAPLFSRETHRLELTPAGLRFRQTAEDLVRRLAIGRDEARLVAEHASGAVRIASTHSLCTTFLPGFLQALEEHEPVGPVRLMADKMSDCEAMMVRGDAHFLLCHRHVAAPEMLDPQLFRNVALGLDRIIPVSAPAPDGGPLHGLPGRPDRPVSALVYDSASGIGRILDAVRRAEMPPHWLAPCFTSHLAVLHRTMALAGRGLAFLPEALIVEDLQRRTLVRAGGGPWEVAVEIRLLRSRARQDPAAERFWTRATAGAGR